MSPVGALAVILVILCFGSLPRWKYSREWSYAPSITFAILLLILLILAFAGMIYDFVGAFSTP